MKYLITFLTLFSFSLKTTKAQYITISDSFFLDCLIYNFPTCITGNQLDTICAGSINDTALFIGNPSIQDLNGLQYFDNLTHLEIVINHNFTWAALPESLKVLTCVNNYSTDLPYLPSALQELNCSYNLLTSLPILPNALKKLNCAYNQLVSLPSLPNSLQLINCSNNQLVNLPALSNALVTLWCSMNQITYMPELPNTLQDLHCSYNQISNLPLVPNNMINFFINSNNISCLLNLPQVGAYYNASIINNPLTCVPNNTFYDLGLQLCIENDSLNNPNNCQIVKNISGFIYSDSNGDCSIDSADIYTENIQVKLFDNQNNLLQISQTVNGIYNFNVLQPDTYKIVVDSTSFLTDTLCGIFNTHILQLDSINQIVPNINFPLICSTGFDAIIQSVVPQGFVFPGQVHTLNTNVTNNETWFNINCDSTINSGTITINLVGPVSYVSPAAYALTPIVNGNNFTYNISDFNSILPSSFGLNLKTDTSAIAGDLICVAVSIATTLLDADTSNNQYNFCYQVVNSYDPNMKEVYPVNVSPDYDGWFTYTIHFQNTGNAPAFNIRLCDTLDSQLDLNTFEVIGFSHLANTTLNGNILAVRFNNIMLPDSTTDYEGSMGYYQYKIKPLSNLPSGAQIENTAYIYFDYNVPIVTNTTQNNFDNLSNVEYKSENKNEFILYPNPGNGIFNFKENSKLKNVEIFNLLGEQILSQSNQKQINLSAHPKGIYFARINGQQVIKLVKE